MPRQDPDYLAYVSATNELEVAKETIAAQSARIARLEEALEKVYDAGLSGIGHVAAANYPEREREARKWVYDAMDAARALEEK